MPEKIHYNNCPVCHSLNISLALVAKDHTVSGESFPIWECKDCSLRFTQDVPDENNIGPYYKSENYISHTNTSRGLINNLYQKVRKRTLRQKRQLVNHATGLSKGSILELGSGTGAFAHEMQSAGWTVTALEPDADARRIGKETFRVELGEIGQFYNLRPQTFDAIVMWHVLEHVHALHNYMDQIKTLLKKEGRLFIAVPNYTSSDAKSYQSEWAAYDVPRHLYHFSPESMKQLVEGHGMEIVSYKPMWFDSFYVSMLSSQYKNAKKNGNSGEGKTNLLGAGVTGLMSNLKALTDTRKCSSVIYIIRKK